MQTDAVEHLPLDEPRPVPRRSRSRAGHPRTGHAHGGRRGLRRRRSARRPAGRRWWRSRPPSPSSCWARPRFERLLADRRALDFLAGAAPCAAGAILGAAVPLALALRESWQFVLLAGAALALLALRRGVVVTLLASGCIGAAARPARRAGSPLTPRRETPGARDQFTDASHHRCRHCHKRSVFAGKSVWYERQ